MSAKRRNEQHEITKNIRTVFPTGFAIGKPHYDDVLVIDFLDQNKDGTEVIGSFLLTKSQIKNLINAITENLEEIEDKS